jgi:diguanylate cyclase (GGDEF)-like protein
LLRELGLLIRCTLRGNDQAFRCGGDEFVVLLHGCNVDAGQSIARRLELLVKRLTEPLKVASPPQLSIGVCSLSELKPPTAESFLQIADTRLYAVKARRPGRRRSA